ncbi:MAG: glutathione peroxidase [Bacteroidetes bacterium]|nr:MAG: glutathione peroxidase [Bacteroidota bacterium]
MTVRQKILKAVYPIWVPIAKIAGRNSKVISNKNHSSPTHSIYDLSFTLNNGKEQKLADFKGKKILLVNTASDCGYTPQYDDLEKIFQKYGNKVIVLGFPANDFKEQEKGDDAQIAEFCKVNFGVTFPLARKSTVIKGQNQDPVFRWLSNKSENGWNDQQPSWNFSKYLIDENGVLTNYFDPSISPSSKEVIDALEK